MEEEIIIIINQVPEEDLPGRSSPEETLYDDELYIDSEDADSDYSGELFDSDDDFSQPPLLNECSDSLEEFCEIRVLRTESPADSAFDESSASSDEEGG